MGGVAVVLRGGRGFEQKADLPIGRHRTRLRSSYGAAEDLNRVVVSSTPLGGKVAVVLRSGRGFERHPATVTAAHLDVAVVLRGGRGFELIAVMHVILKWLVAVVLRGGRGFEQIKALLDALAHIRCGRPTGRPRI